MSRRRLVAIGLISSCLALGGAARAAFLEGPGGGRAAGMGLAFVAVADDASALFHNPSGIVQLDRPELSFLYTKPFGNLDLVNINRNSLAAVFPMDKMVAGVSWNNLIGPSYRENTGTFDLAFRFREWIPQFKNDLAVGVQVAYLSREFILDSHTVGDPVFSGGSKQSGLGVGLSLLSRPDPARLPGLQVGVSAKNLNEPDLGSDSSTLTDRVPRELVVGASYEFPWVRVALDGQERDGEKDLRFGVEGWLWENKRLGLRGGANRDEMDLGFTFVQPFGGRVALSLDYAFQIPFKVEDTSGSHVVSVRLKI